MSSCRELLERLYDGFNAHDMEAALATMHLIGAALLSNVASVTAVLVLR